jgi:hypothetical protein
MIWVWRKGSGQECPGRQLKAVMRQSKILIAFSVMSDGRKNGERRGKGAHYYAGGGGYK